MAYDYLRHYFEFMAREPGTAWCILTSAQAASGEEGNQRYGIVSYGRGQFSLRGVSSENVMYARLKQYFSDRTHGSEANPFDPQALDEVGVEVALTHPLVRLPST